jgi:serine O-acetyltransferase
MPNVARSSHHGIFRNVLLKDEVRHERLLDRVAVHLFNMIYIFRISHFLYRHRIPLLPKLLKILNRVLFSVSVPPSVEIGRNVVFGYQGLGIVVHQNARLGSNIIISPNVVIAGKGDNEFSAPIIEDDVIIGAGACILGPIRVGRGAVVGANAVVISNVVANTTVVGVPAKALTTHASLTNEGIN